MLKSELTPRGMAHFLYRRLRRVCPASGVQIFSTRES